MASKLRFFTLPLLAALLRRVQAHGYVTEVTTPGGQYTGWLPFDDPYASPVPQRIVRKVPGDGPILDINSPDLPCNVGGENPAAAIAEVNAGDDISFTWSTWYSEHRGPFVVHMADCNGSCANFKSSDAKWFTIDQKVFLNDGVTWYTDTFLANGKVYPARIPSNLRPGEYLIRNQLVALHSTAAPQFYMSCSQLRVSGNGNGYPLDSDYSTASELVQGYDKLSIWSYPPPSAADIPVSGKPLASFISDAPTNPRPLSTQVIGDPNPTKTQTIAGATSTHTVCKKSVRRTRTMQPQPPPEPPLLRRNFLGTHQVVRAKRHNDFHY